MDLGQAETYGEPETLIIGPQDLQCHGVHLALVLRIVAQVVRDGVKNSINSFGEVLSGYLTDHLEHVSLLGYHVVKLMSLGGEDNNILERVESILDLLVSDAL